MSQDPTPQDPSPQDPSPQDPMLKDSPSKNAELTPVHKTKSKSKVLVCDDSKLVRLAATKILSELFELELAEDGEEGWDKIAKDDKIQVVFTDLGMPKLDGYGLIHRVRTSEVERIRNLPMVVITGATDEEDIRRKLFEVGATDFVTKPFKATAIIARADAHTTYQNVNSALQKSSNIDPATGLLNAQGFKEQLQKDISFINRHAESCAVAIFELDNFQAIYDQIGKKTAELVIKESAKTLASVVRKEDSVSRDGLSKFVVLLPMAKAQGVINLAKRVSAKISSFKLSVRGKPIALSVSVGISTVSPGYAASGEGIVQCAEQALSNAKTIGNGEIQFIKLEGEPDSAEEVSIDGLLSLVDEGETNAVIAQIESVIQRLSPLIALLDDEQKKLLFTSKPM